MKSSAILLLILFLFSFCVSASLCYLCIWYLVSVSACVSLLRPAASTGQRLHAVAASAAGQIAIWRCDRQIMKCQESHLNDLMVRCRVPNAGELVNKQSTVAGLTCTRKLTHTDRHTHTRLLLWHLESVCPLVVQYYDRSKYCLHTGYITCVKNE